jgi:hypothetical protein
MNKIKVEQLRGNNGPVKNQFVIWFEDGKAFQSYNSVIAIKYFDGRTVLDAAKWDYSVTTGKYRNIFLNEDKKETERKIRAGVYTLEDLN